MCDGLFCILIAIAYRWVLLTNRGKDTKNNFRRWRNKSGKQQTATLHRYHRGIIGRACCWGRQSVKVSRWCRPDCLRRRIYQWLDIKLLIKIWLNQRWTTRGWQAKIGTRGIERAVIFTSKKILLIIYIKTIHVFIIYSSEVCIGCWRYKKISLLYINK